MSDWWKERGTRIGLGPAVVPIHEKAEQSRALLQSAIEEYSPEAVCGLFSGGNDSTVVMHVVRPLLTHVVHVNTGIGIEQTRQFVRDQAVEMGLPLIEEYPPEGCTYEDTIMRWGFPGPAGHRVVYNRLKERALRKVRKRFITNGRKQRVIFASGIRRHESQRRMPLNKPIERVGSIVWVNPLFEWNSDDMADYRKVFTDVPRNEVADNLHMSGECLCGAFARPGELDEIEFFYPETAAHIRELEKMVEAAGHKACKWGVRPPKSAHGTSMKREAPGPLCSDCGYEDEA